jgi:presenilin-like A22 family membrane protease
MGTIFKNFQNKVSYLNIKDLTISMKHKFNISLILIMMFLAAQFLGIAIIYNNIDTQKSSTEETMFKEIPFLERPPVQENYSFLPIIFAVLIGTAFLLLLMKYNLTWVWKIWFLLAVTMSLTVAFGSFIPYSIALLLALVFGLWKIFKPNFWVQNITELFIYGGLAVIFVPLFNVLSVTILMVLIAIYDAYAVWKSKHMITLAKSQTKAKIFAGLLIPYDFKNNKAKISHKISKIKNKHNAKGKSNDSKKKSTGRVAMLGGGDIAFPIIFAGVMLKEFGLWQSLIIPFFALAGLITLLLIGKEKKFYPAMPFISSGCLLGLGVIYLFGLIF